MTDHYAALMVDSSASASEVRAAFRRMVKKCHPDVNHHRRKWAHKRMKALLAAYETLSDAGKRAAYDLRLGRLRESRRDAYHDRLAARSDPESRARLILYDLLQGNEGEAIQVLETVCEEDPLFDVADYLSPRDWMDCKFLLAEEYERRRAFERALELYEAIYQAPLARSHYRNYLEEVKDRVRNLCCRDLARTAAPEQAIAYYRRALRLDLKRAQAAFLHKKMAEAYYEVGRIEDALSEMKRALDLKPDLKGRQKISRRLGITL